MYSLIGQNNVKRQTLKYVKQVITRSPMWVYLDPDKQYYLFSDSRKHSLSGIIMQYHEHIRVDGRISVPHPIMYQSCLLQRSQNKLGSLTKEAFAIYMSFVKWYSI